METHSVTLERVLAASPPPLLFHYTVPTGLIGIIESKEAWATNVTYLNDAKEIEHAVDCARWAIDNLLRLRPWKPEEREVIHALRDNAGSAAKRYYVFSLSEERDLLSQWRAYCPNGGYAIGFPPGHLVRMAQKQGFSLLKCIYDTQLHYQISCEIVESFVRRHAKLSVTGPEGWHKSVIEQTAWEYAQHIARVGTVFKHPSFSEEKEWRLISDIVQEPHPQLAFRATSNKVVPYFRFRLADDEFRSMRIGGEFLTIVVGPCSDMPASQMAVQFLITPDMPNAGWSVSSVPYRTW